MKIDQKWAVGGVFVAAMCMNGLDATAVGPALLTMSRELAVTPAATNLVEVTFLVAFAITLPVAGWVGDRFGSKRAFLAALAVFTAASALCGLAPSFILLLFARIVQGAASGFLTPVGMAMMFRTFSPAERLSVSRITSIPTALAPAAGPVLGGYFTERASWRDVFFLNVPIGVAAFAFGLACVEEHREPEPGPFDARGFALAVPGFGLLLYGLGESPDRGFAAPVMAMMVVGALLLALLVRVELSAPFPMLELRLLGQRTYRDNTVVIVCASAGLFGMLYVFPLMYQDALGASALDAGLTVFPEALGLLLAAQLVPFSYAKLGARKLTLLSMAIAAGVFTAMSLVGPETHRWAVRALLFSVGLFLGHAVLSLQTTAFAEMPGPKMGRAVSLFNVHRQIGAALGVAVGAFVVSSSLRGTSLASYQLGLVSAAAFLAIGALAATRLVDVPLPDEGGAPLDAAESSAPEPLAAGRAEST